MVRLARALAVAVILAIAATTEADTYRSKDVDCPICSNRFTVELVSSMTQGGVDGDLAPRVVGGGAVLARAVWSCPRCRYAAWARDFSKGVKPETKARILAGLEPMEPLPADTSPIPVALSFDLAARILALEGATAERRGWTFLTGAWAVRQGSGVATRPVYEDEQLAARWREAHGDAWEAGMEAVIPMKRALLKRLLRLEAEAAQAARAALAARKAGTPDPILTLAAAWLHRRTGEHARAAPFVASLLADGDLPAPIRAAAQDLEVSIRRERALQERALPLLLEAAHDPAVDGAVRTRHRISAADTLRRLGRPADAVPLFVLAAQDAELNDWHVAVVRHGLVQCAALAGENEQAVVAAEARSRAALLKQLAVPETARGAARIIGNSDDPSYWPAIAKALASDEDAVCDAALLAVLRMEELPLPEDVRLALEARAGDPTEGSSERSRALGRLALEAHPASRPLFLKVLSDADEWLRGRAIEGLARCGEAPAAEALVARLGAQPGRPEDYVERKCLLALSGLANRELLTRDAARAWWKDARAKGREAWVLEGFRTTGKSISSLQGRAAIVVLLELLDHEHPWIRWNAERALHEETGERIGWHFDLHKWRPPEKRRGPGGLASIQARAWRAWWATDGSLRPKWTSKR